MCSAITLLGAAHRNLRPSVPWAAQHLGFSPLALAPVPPPSLRPFPLFFLLSFFPSLPSFGRRLPRALLGAEGSRERGREGLVSIFLCGRGWSRWRAGGERGDPGAAEPWMARRGAMDSAKSGGLGRSETGRGAPGAGWGLARPAAAALAGPGRPRSPPRRAPTRKTMGSPRPPPRPGPDPRGGSGESPPRPKRTSLMDLP